LWRAHRKGREEELRANYAQAIDDAYTEICAPLHGTQTILTYGNVDNVDVMLRHLPESTTFIETGTITLAGQAFGIVGGGVPTINSPGEISDEEMAARLDSIGSVDVLCTHVAPDVGPLATDVVGGQAKGSPAVRAYLERHQPKYHYFGDIHQPQAVTWTVGRTRCINVGYFRATGRVVQHHAG
jgi:Icc-related predicted phosphoesterase